MSTTEIRNRAVVFRLSDSEYRMVRQASSRARRNMSDYMRWVLLSAVTEQSAVGPAEVDEQLMRLQATLQNLRDLLAEKPGVHGSGGRGGQ